MVFHCSYVCSSDVYFSGALQCAFVQKALTKRGRMECRDVADWPDQSLMHLPVEDARRADLALFLVKLTSGEAWTPWAEEAEHVKEATTCYNKERRSKFIARHSHALAVVIGEVKLDNPGFGDYDTSFLLISADAEQTRGQIIDYATEVMLRQHRCFVFVFYIYRGTARLLRVDRNGAVVTKVIDLGKEPEVFFEFFYRLKDASDIELGFDPTATMVFESAEDQDLDPDAKPLREALQTALDQLNPAARVTSYITEAFEEGKTMWPLYKLDVPDKKIGTRSFLVRNLTTSSVSPTGRATRGYIAFDIEEKAFRFLKDYWLATVCCGGDLSMPGGELQVTRTQELGSTGYLRRIHTRIVLNEVGIPLKDYKNSKELCVLVKQAMKGSLFLVFLTMAQTNARDSTAHEWAWVKADVLHRDISDTNIVIDEEFIEGKNPKVRALLIDWDLCKYKGELDQPSQKNRSVSETPSVQTICC